MSDRIFTDEELGAAIESIAAPGRLREAQDVVARTAPSLQRLLGTALSEGGWFDLGHSQAVRQAAGTEDPVEREREVQTLVAEETRLGMLVGVAVGFELARELGRAGPGASGTDEPSDLGTGETAENTNRGPTQTRETTNTGTTHTRETPNTED